jgi:hypothetical protein
MNLWVLLATNKLGSGLDRLQYAKASGIIGTIEFVSASHSRLKDFFTFETHKTPRPLAGLDGGLVKKISREPPIISSVWNVSLLFGILQSNPPGNIYLTVKILMKKIKL